VLWERDTGNLVGIASIHRIDWSRRSAGLGYWVRKSAQRRGYATEAAAALVEDAFRRVGLHRIEAHVAVENRASQRVPEKLGFTNEGIARESELIGGSYIDHIQYSLLARDPVGSGPRPGLYRVGE
jgi:ribosomal-protein-serine acetyltransferase